MNYLMTSQKWGQLVSIDAAKPRNNLFDHVMEMHGAAPTKRVSNILLVEDDKDTSVAISRVLMSDGFAVTSSQVAEHALVVIRVSGRVDVAIVDLVLPGMGGVRFIEQALKDRPDLKVLMITGSDDEKALARLPPGIPLLRKPMRRADLLSAVHDLLDDAQPDAEPSHRRI